MYCAKDLRLDRTVALKLIAPELAATTPSAPLRARIAGGRWIDHPHIVPIFEAGETDGVLYIAMRYVPGLDLRALLDRDGPLPVATALRIASQVASALDAAHEHDLVHRDVKPGNILVAEGTDSDHPEHVYLTDFGLTKNPWRSPGSPRQRVRRHARLRGTGTDLRPPGGRQVRPLQPRLRRVRNPRRRSAFEREDDMALLWAHSTTSRLP